jgi:hypothetical protein
LRAKRAGHVEPACETSVETIQYDAREQGDRREAQVGDGARHGEENRDHAHQEAADGAPVGNGELHPTCWSPLTGQ